MHKAPYRLTFYVCVMLP